MIDFLLHWMDKIVQGLAWKSILSHFLWVDWLAILFVIFGILYGARKGLMGEIAEIFQLAIINYFVFDHYSAVATFLSQNVPQISHHSVEAVSFILTGIVVFVIVAYLAYLIKKLVHSEVVKPLRLLGGMFLGVFHLFFLLSFVSQALLRFPSRPIQNAYRQGFSYTGYYLNHLAPKFYQLMREPILLLQEKPKEESA